MDNEDKEPSVAQRQAMAKLAEEAFAKRIEVARDKEGQLVQEITDDLRRELGVDALEHQINTLEDQVRILEKKREKLGWGSYGVLGSSKAERLLKGRVSDRSTDVKTLEAHRKQVLAAIWTCKSLEELEKLVEDV